MTIMSRMMSPGTGRKPLDRAQRRAWRTHQKLLEAALELFHRQGVDATSIHQITERADVGKGSFYRHFPSKEQLRQELVSQAVAELVAGIAGLQGGWTTLAAAIDALLAEHLGFFEKAPRQFALLFQDRLLLGRQAKSDELEGPYLQYVQQLQAHLAPLTGGPAEAEKLRQLAHAMAGFVSGHCSFATMGLSSSELKTQLEPFRRGFVAAAANFMVAPDSAGTATAASPRPDTGKETVQK